MAEKWTPARRRCLTVFLTVAIISGAHFVAAETWIEWSAYFILFVFSVVLTTMAIEWGD